MAEKDSKEIKESLKERFVAREMKDLQSLDMYRASLAEFLGTMFLVMYGVGAGLYHVPNGPTNAPSSVHISLETGFFLVVIITSLTTVSGGHVNPAVSIGFLLTGNIGLIRFVFYVVAQVVGAITGAGIMNVVAPVEMQGNLGVISPGTNVTDAQAFVCEAYITFLLNFGVFSFIDPGRTDVAGSVPVVIGLLVTINVFATWNLSGGCMNPARNFGPIVITGKYEKAWIYWLGPMVGGAVGAVVYDRIFSTKVCKRMRQGCKANKYEFDSSNQSDMCTEMKETKKAAV